MRQSFVLTSCRECEGKRGKELRFYLPVPTIPLPGTTTGVLFSYKNISECSRRSRIVPGTHCWTHWQITHFSLGVWVLVTNDITPIWIMEGLTSQAGFRHTFPFKLFTFPFKLWVRCPAKLLLNWSYLCCEWKLTLYSHGIWERIQVTFLWHFFNILPEIKQKKYT